ncbi:MAG: DNA polymerase III subunit beta [Candidatus Marinimicrobia bacterium]|nr:DNA polymerase III subunit beta [Candidatus Neomarinimicrobiota bacterium]
MKFTVSKKVLYTTLQQVIKVTPVRSTLPILSCVLFTAKENDLEMRSTDLEITVQTHCPIQGEKDGSIAIPGRMLLEVSSELPNSDLRFDVDLEKERITISTMSGGEYVIVGRPANEFPSPPNVDNQGVFTFNKKVLQRIIDKTAFAVTRDDMKISLSGVLFQFKENEFRAVATDGHRLVRYIRHDFPNNDYINDILIPTKFLSLLSVNAKGDEDMELRIGKNHIMAVFTDMTLYSRLIDERYPDYESVIPTNNKHIIKADIDELLAAVKRITIFSSKNTHQVQLKLSSSVLNLSTEDIETASMANEDIPVKYDGEEFSINLNGEYIKDILRHIDGENIEIQMNSHMSASLFFPEIQEAGEDLLMLLMPIRSSN